MGFNSVMELMRKNSPDVDPLAEMARQNEAVKNAVLGAERRRELAGASRAEANETTDVASPPLPVEASPESIVLEIEDSEGGGDKAPEPPQQLVPAPDSQELDIDREIIRQKLMLHRVRMKNKKLEQELALKELRLAAKKAFLAENHHLFV